MEQMRHILVELTLQLVSIVRSIERKDDGVCHPDDLQAEVLRDSDMAEEAWVRVEFLPALRIEDGMVVIDSITRSTSKPVVCACNLGDNAIRL